MGKKKPTQPRTVPVKFDGETREMLTALCLEHGMSYSQFLGLVVHGCFERLVAEVNAQRARREAAEATVENE